MTARVKALALALLLAGLASLTIVSSAGAGTIHEFESSFKVTGLLEGPGSIAIDEEAEVIYVVNSDYSASNLERFDFAGNPLQWPAVPGPNESQSIDFESSLSLWEPADTFTLTCPNAQTTAPIEFGNEVPELWANIKAALEAKCGGTFTVSNGLYAVAIQFEGTFGSMNVPKMTCTVVTGAGSCPINGESDGASGTTTIPVICCSQIAVDNSGGPNQGTIYVGTFGDNTRLQVFLPDGTAVGPITNVPGDPPGYATPPCGVDVDDDGNLYVTHAGYAKELTFVDRYAPLEWVTHPHQIVPATGTIRPLDYITVPCRTAIDSNKSLLINTDWWGGLSTINRLAPDSFGPLEPFKGGAGTPFVTESGEPEVDRSNDDVYVTQLGRIARLDSSGALIEEFGEGVLENAPGGIAVNAQTGKVYVSNGQIKVFKPIIVPDALTEDPTGVVRSVATLHGHVDPAGAGEITGCQFQYVKDSLYNSSRFASATSVPCQPPAPLNSPADVKADLSGLTVEEGFHYRLRATNAKGTANGTVKAFRTRAVLDANTKAAAVAPRSATLNGSFTGEGAPTEYFYEWGTDEGYGNSTPIQTLPSPAGTTQTPQAISGLELETLYHYRLVAANSFGTTKGDDMTFTTTPAVTSLETKAASSLDPENITLNAQFQGDGIDTKYYFEYGLTTAYGSLSPENDAGVTSGATQAPAEIDLFSGYRTYHYRVVAVNSFGKTIGQDLTFVAPETPEPEIGNTRTVSVTPTTATVSTEVNPNHWETVYLFEWGINTHDYGTGAPFGEPISGLDNKPIEVTQELTGLTPGTVYFFRAVAANFRGTTEGEEVSFTTPDAPRVESTFSDSVGGTSAHLSGLVAAVTRATNVSFQYGQTTAYGQNTPEIPIGDDLTSRRVDADIGNLAPVTTYHFRIVATNAIGTTYGPDRTFTTLVDLRSAANCNKLSSRAKQKNDEARRLRSKAKSAKGKRAKNLRRQAKEASKLATKLSKEADACRSTSGGSGK